MLKLHRSHKVAKKYRTARTSGTASMRNRHGSMMLPFDIIVGCCNVIMYCCYFLIVKLIHSELWFVEDTGTAVILHYHVF